MHKTMHTLAGTSILGHWGSQLLQGQVARSRSPYNPDNDHVLVMIFLNGGNDSLNTVVPINQLSILDQLRPHVILPESSLIHLSGTNLGFHPSLEGLRSLYDEGMLRIIRGVGYAQQNFSHFRSSDIWMSGSDAEQVLGSGWMGRYLNVDYPDYPQSYPNANMPDPLSIELGYSNSLLFQGPLANMSVVINGERSFYQLVEDEVDAVPNTLYGEKLAHAKLVRRQSQVYGSTIRDAAQNVNQQFTGYPDTSIAQQLKICARLIAGGLRTPVYKVEQVGYDTHAAQVDPSDHRIGVHANLLRDLDQAISAFMQDLSFLGIADRVVGMTFSEFGRRIVSNASFGTDHGSAGPMFVFGHSVDPGVLGEDYVLDAGMNYADNLVHQFDYRQVYTSMLEQWLCVDSGRADQTLLGAYASLPIISPAACTTTPTVDPNLVAEPYLKAFPNPVRDLVNLSFVSDGNPLSIELIDIQGRLLQNLVWGTYPRGKRDISVSLDQVISGTYFIRLNTRSRSQAITIQKI